MKANILADGTLVIQPETDIENYALKKWREGWIKKESIFEIHITKENKVSTMAIEAIKEEDL